ncbi:hypothetical protein M885DRAFT_81961 [Pelagophyceae sp. CCMP2097]|nr:hypothetical protein M885DRAFT_81961 [Pelagophyceae sp. CCMP2097]
MSVSLAVSDDVARSVVRLFQYSTRDSTRAGDEEDVSIKALETLQSLTAALKRGSSELADIHIVLLPLSQLLLRPLPGRRRDAALEAAVAAADDVAQLCGPALAGALGVEPLLQLLGGIGLRLSELSTAAFRGDTGGDAPVVEKHNFVESHDERLAGLLRLGVTLLRGCREASALGSVEAQNSWLEVWKCLDDPLAPTGRQLVAGLASAATDVATARQSPRASRSLALNLLRSLVAATPPAQRGALWRCFLPGLFGRLYRIAVAPSAPREGGALRAQALDAATVTKTASIETVLERVPLSHQSDRLLRISSSPSAPRRRKKHRSRRDPSPRR